jgi:geranylgeranyl pyrophosphate synthase
MNDSSLTQKAFGIIQNHGQPALAQATKKILKSPYDEGIVCEALHYYAQTVLPKVLPIFPALISLSSNACSATPVNSSSLATAMMLITSSGDIHDDIVDNSTRKFATKTVVGKYGKDVPLLAGDLLLTQGMTMLQNECGGLSGKQRKAVFDLVAASMVEIVKAEALEMSLWHKATVLAEEYFEVIRLKGGVAELHCRIGGIVGGGNREAVDNLAGYGRVIGVLATLKEEFVDLANVAELGHRIKNELPPYPMLCAIEADELKTAFAKKSAYSAEDLQTIAEAVWDSLAVKKLNAKFKAFGRKELGGNPLLICNERAKELVVLLAALTEELTLV